MNTTRDSKIDAALSGLVLLAFLAIVTGNVLTFGGAAEMQGRWVILGGLILGTLGASALSARVFWRHRIGLAAWMLMFGLHATGMALATQLFNWLHPAAHASNDKNAPNINALLLAAALISTLLVRGAVLQAAVKNMPGWLAIRKENESATPRLWLFALYWLSPLAWWSGIICVLNLRATEDAGFLWIVALILCIAIAITRVAVQFVLFEKNKYSNWRRGPEGWAKFRAFIVTAGFVVAGVATFYAYFFMATRVQDDALAARIRGAAEARVTELKSFQPPSLPPTENAETIYKLARLSNYRLNHNWAEMNWNAPSARNEVAKNLTALSYFRQAAAVKGIDFGINYDFMQFSPSGTFRSELDDVQGCVLLDLRQTAANGKWQAATENFKACLRYVRHRSALPTFSSGETTLKIETKSVLTVAAALFQPDAKPNDIDLIEFRKALTEHLEARGEFYNRSLYFRYLFSLVDLDRERINLGAWPGKADVDTMLRESALRRWSLEMDWDSMMTMLKLMMTQRMDREEINQFVERERRHSVTYLFINEKMCAKFDAMESLRLLEAAIGVKRYQQHFGTWPSTLNDCVPLYLPSVPSDPNKRGQFIQYESSPPRVYTIGTSQTALPEGHGFPDENYFQNFSLKIKECENGNHVLFLAN